MKSTSNSITLIEFKLVENVFGGLSGIIFKDFHQSFTYPTSTEIEIQWFDKDNYLTVINEKKRKFT